MQHAILPEEDEKKEEPSLLSNAFHLFSMTEIAMKHTYTLEKLIFH